MSLRISLIRGGATIEVLYNGLDSSVIEANNIWRRIERVKGGEEGLSMIATYTEIENALGVHLRYLKIM